MFEAFSEIVLKFNIKTQQGTDRIQHMFSARVPKPVLLFMVMIIFIWNLFR